MFCPRGGVERAVSLNVNQGSVDEGGGLGSVSLIFSRARPPFL